jgi:hypothetical protein
LYANVFGAQTSGVPAYGRPFTVRLGSEKTCQGCAPFIQPVSDPDGLYVYWVEQGDPGDGYQDGTVRRRKKDGSDVVVTMAGGQKQPFDITGDATSIYWLNAGEVADSGATTETGQVMRLPK